MSIPYNPPAPRPQHAPPVVPSPVRVEVVEDRSNSGRDAWQIITNAIVVITCLAVLYSLYAVYSALSQLGDNLRQVGL